MTARTETETKPQAVGAVAWMEQAWLRWAEAAPYPIDPKLAFIAGMDAGLDFAAWLNARRCTCHREANP